MSSLPITVGAEFEFTSTAMNSEEGNPAGFTHTELETHKAFMEQVEANCKIQGCSTQKLPPNYEKFSPPEYKVTYPDGWWFVVSLDPGCVEIQTRPSTIEELKSLEPRMTRDIFGIAKKLALFSDPKTGAGHFNFGANSAFENDPESFLRFFADYENHPELSLGVLGHDESNGPTMALRPEKERQAFKEIIDELANGKITTLQEATQAVQRRVYTRHPVYPNDPGWAIPYHYTGIGLKGPNSSRFPGSDKPVELRSIFPQRNMQDFILLADLIEARIRYLNEKGGPPIYKNITKTKFTRQELVNTFYSFT